MKQMGWLVVCILFLMGCAAEPVYETMGNIWESDQLQSAPASIEFAAEEVQVAAMESDGSRRSYQVGNWIMWTEVMDGGDLYATMQELTGTQEPDIISYPLGKYQCHETAWAVSGEEGECVVRTAVIPQGQYHYCLSIKAPKQEAVQMGSFFTRLLKSVHLNDTAQ